MGDSAGLPDLPDLPELHLRSASRLAALALALVAAPALWFITTDLWVAEVAPALLSGRLVVRVFLVGVPLAGIALLRRCRDRAAFRRASFAVALALGAAVTAINVLRPAGSGLPVATPMFVAAVMYAALPNTLWRQAAPPLLMTAGLVAIHLAWLRSPGARMAGELVTLAALNAVGVLLVRQRLELEAGVDEAWERERRARRAAEDALAELTTLRGIIPICAHCKNVRTGRGDWQRIEQYVHEHSAAEFSHGVCPECLRRHYPEASG